jgi:hypothetical protein
MRAIIAAIGGLLLLIGIFGAISAGIGGFITWLQTGDDLQARCYVTEHGPKMYRDSNPNCRK